VDGGNLRQIQRAGRLAPEQALTIVPQICDALQFAHNEGIVHRDIKPENILLDKKGRVKITDFGIAKMLGQAAEASPLTGAGDVVGTPHYMAPEQIEKPLTVDHRADIYSLGVVFYEMLTGELPLGKFTPPSRMVKVDVRLDEIVLQALEKEPALRYQQASQVKTAVETIVNTPGPRPKAQEPDSGLAADALTRRVLARDYFLGIGSCLRRGWALVRSDFWPLVGVTALVLVLWSAASALGEVTNSASNIKLSTSVLGVLISGPLMGGLCLHFLKKIRGEPVRIETAFSGFSRSFLHLVMAGFVTTVLTMLGFLCLILPGVYLVVAWMFTLPLVIDRRLDFWPAMRLSRQTISKHWWKFLGFLLVLALLNLAGIVACCIGVFVTIPVSLAALMYAYEDIFSSGTPINLQAEGKAAVA
jgi:serine/threonine protein kinase